MKIEKVFRSNEGQRDKYLARVFGLFSEEAVRCWCSDAKNKYEDLGRPRLSGPGQSKAYILDFTFRHRRSGRVFIGEQKFWPEYQGYQFLRIDRIELLDGFETNSFQAFLACAAEPEKFRVFCDGGEFTPSGAIFVTGAITGEADEKIRQRFRFHEILCLEEIITDLISSKNKCWRDVVENRSRWSQELYDAVINGRGIRF